MFPASKSLLTLSSWHFTDQASHSITDPLPVASALRSIVSRTFQSLKSTFTGTQTRQKWHNLIKSCDLRADRLQH